MFALRPSAANLWMNCPGFAKLSSTLPPDAPSDPAREGTCAAWVAEMVLTGQAARCADLIETQHPENGWLIESSMAKHIQKYVDLVRSYGGSIHAERRVVFNDLVAGTPDCFAVSDNGTLRVDDLKYGYEIVEPSSQQVWVYAAALYRMLKSQGVVIHQIVVGIYQPRAFHPQGVHRTRTLSAQDIEAFAKRAEQAAQAAQQPDALCIAGTWCRRCSAAHKCAAVTHEVYRAVTTMQNDQEREMTATEMAAELTFLDMAEAMFKGRKDAVQAEAEARLRNGKPIPGWHIEQGYGQRRWTVSANIVTMLTGVDPTAGKMVTPAELERNGADPDVVSALTETPRTKAKLKPMPDGYLASKFGE